MEQNVGCGTIATHSSDWFILKERQISDMYMEGGGDVNALEARMKWLSWPILTRGSGIVVWRRGSRLSAPNRRSYPVHVWKNKTGRVINPPSGKKNFSRNTSKIPRDATKQSTKSFLLKRQVTDPQRFKKVDWRLTVYLGKASKSKYRQRFSKSKTVGFTVGFP